MENKRSGWFYMYFILLALSLLGEGVYLFIVRDKQEVLWTTIVFIFMVWLLGVLMGILGFKSLQESRKTYANLEGSLAASQTIAYVKYLILLALYVLLAIVSMFIAFVPRGFIILAYIFA